MPIQDAFVILAYLFASPIVGALVGWRIATARDRRRSAALRVMLDGYWTRLLGYQRRETEVTLTGRKVEGLVALKAQSCRKLGTP
jgi:hypothetical protein